jgi:hypothetical protein
MEEQRQANRVPFEGSIQQLLTHGSDYPRLGGDDEFVNAKALNLSSGGLACESTMKLEPLSQVYLIFSIQTPEGERRIRCEGYVAHSACEGESCTFGIRFHELSPEDQAAIDRFVAVHNPG